MCVMYAGVNGNALSTVGERHSTEKDNRYNGRVIRAGKSPTQSNISKISEPQRTNGDVQDKREQREALVRFKCF